MMRERCLLVFKVRGQRSKSYCHIEGKRCRQETERTISFRIIQLCTIDHHGERKMLIVFFRSEVKLNIVGKRDRIRCMQNTD